VTLHTLTLEDLRRYVPRIDRAWLALALLFAALWAFLPHQAGPSAIFTLEALVDIAPFLVVSVALAAYLRAAGAERLIARVFSGNLHLMIATAALFGALSPFCSCGVIPIIAALLTMGVPLPPVMAFWLASPVMAPDMFVLTAGTLGLGFAVAKTLAAIGLGLLGGWGTLAILRLGLLGPPLREGIGGCSCSASALLKPQETRWDVWREVERRRLFAGAAGETALFLLKWLALAFAIESLMVAYLPPEQVGGWLGGESLWAIPLSVLVGVPAYLNGYAALPVVAGLMEAGMAPGAALAFLTAGGVTSLPAAIAVFALVRRPVFLWYLAQALIGSALAGVLYQWAVSW